MLTIFLTILKIIGILLLVVIGLLILGILAILFVPLRYDGKISYNEKNQCVATHITWLFRLIYIEGGYQEKVYARAKLFWFTLWKWKADEKENDKEDHLESADYSEEELDRLLEERSQKEESKEETKEAKVIEEKLDEPDAEENLTEVQPTEIEPKEVELNEAKSNEAESKEKKPKKIQFQQIGKIQQIGKRTKKIKEKIKHIKEMASDQRIHRAILLLIDGAWKMARHSLPRKIKGRAKFGFEDPSTTGQILTYVSLLYPCYAKSVELVPMFTEKVIDLDLYFRGRVRLFSLIWICVKIWFDRNFRYLYKKVRKK